MKNKILKTHIIGAFVSVLLGSFLHFFFELTGEFKPAALIGGVNESTWEHLKIAFWPMFFFAVYEFFAYRNLGFTNFWIAKGVSLTTAPVAIIALFYGYLLVIEDSLVMDILIFIISIILAYIVSYKIMHLKKDLSWLNTAGILLIISLLLGFSLFSYFPPETFLFEDPVNGGYGV